MPVQKSLAVFGARKTTNYNVKLSNCGKSTTALVNVYLPSVISKNTLANLQSELVWSQPASAEPYYTFLFYKSPYILNCNTS